MSEGPIKQWRDGHKTDRVSTPDAHRVCAPSPVKGRGYCGRKNDRTAPFKDATCADCHAAARADKEAG